MKKIKKIIIGGLAIVVFLPIVLIAQWVQTAGPFGGDVRCLAIDSAVIYAGTYWGGGIFRSTDNGNNWVPINNGLSQAYVQCVTINAGKL